MSEPIPVKETDFKPIVGILWIALITAIVVTIIDWKIKQDILRLTDAFYKVYPATLEAQHGAPKTDGLAHDSSVLRFPILDDDSRVEAEDVPGTDESELERTQEFSTRGFWDDLPGEPDSGAENNPGRISEESIDFLLGD